MLSSFTGDLTIVSAETFSLNEVDLASDDVEVFFSVFEMLSSFVCTDADSGLVFSTIEATTGAFVFLIT